MKGLVILFIKIHFLLNSRFGIRIKGLGRVQKLLKREFVFTAFSKKLWYLPTVEGSYDYLLIGESNEPETHIFLHRIFSELEEAVFIDVGASIGEFVFSVSNYPCIKKVYAFEPRPDCVRVLNKNCELNGLEQIEVFPNVVSNENGMFKLHLNGGGTSSGIFHIGNNSTKSINVKSVMLDNVLPKTLKNPVLLMDIEGAEPLAIEGGREFIEINSPLIIFEYNSTSKIHFSLADITRLIGERYTIWRIKNDGTLDNDFSLSWNCVAIPSKSIFERILLK